MMTKVDERHTLSLGGYECNKHGVGQGGVLIDNRRFCPKCVADFLQRNIGEVRTISRVI